MNRAPELCPGSLGVLESPLPLCWAVCVSRCVCLRLAGLPLQGVTRHPASLLSQPLFKRFTQTRWVAPTQTLEEIISTVAERLPEFSELHDCFREVRRSWTGGGARWAWGGWRLDTHPNTCAVHTPADTHTRAHTSTCIHLPAPRPRTPGFEASRLRGKVVSSPGSGSHSPACSPGQELVEVIHLHLVKEYVIRLSKRSLVLKTAEQQQQLAEHILANADAIQRFCSQNVSSRLPLPRAPAGPAPPRPPHT